MAEKVDPALSDPGIKPTDDYIFGILGDKQKLWKEIMSHMNQNYDGSEGGWNYYNDGKRWLFKLIYKKKTVFWIGIFEDTFRITFYFADKAQPLINDSSLPDRIKDEFAASKKYGAVRAVSIIMKEKSDVDNVLELISIKVALK
jgi:hypothetical protein